MIQLCFLAVPAQQLKLFCEFSLFHNKTAEGTRLQWIDEELKEMSEGLGISDAKCFELVFYCLKESKLTSVLLGQVKYCSACLEKHCWSQK